MIRFQLLGVRFCLPLLSLLAPLLAAKLGMHGNMGSLALSLCAHELAHLLAARLMRVEILEIRLMPFGGSARMENPYGVAPARLLVVAAAGPAANLCLLLLAAALAHWGLLDGVCAAALMGPNLVLMLFNLLPALPLDGGRILYALLEGRLGRERALRLCIALGRILSALLLAAAILLRIRGGKWNLSIILAAVFILASGPDERAALLRSRAELLRRGLETHPEPRPARFYQLDGQTPAERALRLLRPGEDTWFVLTNNGAPEAVLDAASLLRALLHSDPTLPLSALGGYSFAQKKDCCQ